MPLFILSIGLQVALVLHIVKTGRNTTWIWIVIMLPMAGSIAYLIVELLPEFTGSRTGRKAAKSLTQIIDPQRDLKRAANDFALSDSIENSMRLAKEMVDKGMYAEAKDLYQKCLKGIHKTDPYLMFGLARAEFQLQQYPQALKIMDELIEANPDFKNPDAHLLYARIHAALGNVAEAKHEFEVLQKYFAGPEANCHYARFCKQNGDIELANSLYNEILNKAKISGSHYRSLHREWIKIAKEELNH